MVNPFDLMTKNVTASAEEISEWRVRHLLEVHKVYRRLLGISFFIHVVIASVGVLFSDSIDQALGVSGSGIILLVSVIAMVSLFTYSVTKLFNWAVTEWNDMNREKGNKQ